MGGKKDNVALYCTKEALSHRVGGASFCPPVLACSTAALTSSHLFLSQLKWKIHGSKQKITGHIDFNTDEYFPPRKEENSLEAVDWLLGSRRALLTRLPQSSCSQRPVTSLPPSSASIAVRRRIHIVCFLCGWSACSELAILVIMITLLVTAVAGPPEALELRCMLMMSPLVCSFSVRRKMFLTVAWGRGALLGERTKQTAHK